MRRQKSKKDRLKKMWECIFACIVMCTGVYTYTPLSDKRVKKIDSRKCGNISMCT